MLKLLIISSRNFITQTIYGDDRNWHSGIMVSLHSEMRGLREAVSKSSTESIYHDEALKYTEDRWEGPTTEGDRAPLCMGIMDGKVGLHVELERESPGECLGLRQSQFSLLPQL